MRIAAVSIALLMLGGLVAQCAPGEGQSFTGIGVELKEQGESFVIRRALPGSPAEKAGVTAGSTLVSIDGKPVKGMVLQGVLDLIRGAEGTELTLVVARDLGQTQTFKVKRARMEAIRPETFPGTYTVQGSPSEQVIVERVSGNQFRIRSPQQHWAGMGLVGNGCFKGVFQMEDVAEVLKDFRGAAGFVRIDFRFGDTLQMRTRFNFWDNADRMVEKTLVRKT